MKDIQKNIEGTNCNNCKLDRGKVCNLICPRNFPFTVKVESGVPVAVSLSGIVHPSDFNQVCLG